MRYFILGLFIFSSLVYVHPVQAKAVDGIVAVVNDDVITQSELNEALSIVKEQAAKSNASLPPKIREQILNQLINKKIQLQIAKQQGINPTSVEVNKAIEKIAKQNQVSVHAVYQKVKEQGLNSLEYQEKIKEQLVLGRLQQQEIRGTFTPVSKEEVDHFMHSAQFKHYLKPESYAYHIIDILIPFSDTPSAQNVKTARKEAEFILTKMRRGLNYEDIVKNASTLSAQQNDLGWMRLEELPTLFAPKVAHVQNKQIIGPIQAANGFHLLNILDLKKVQLASANNATPPTRKEVETMLMERKYEEAIQKWVEKLRTQSYIQIQ